MIDTVIPMCCLHCSSNVHNFFPIWPFISPYFWNLIWYLISKFYILVLPTPQNMEYQCKPCWVMINRCVFLFFLLRSTFFFLLNSLSKPHWETPVSKSFIASDLAIDMSYCQDFTFKSKVDPSELTNFEPFFPPSLSYISFS